MLDFFTNTISGFKFNPFSGLSDEELKQVMVPQINLPKLVKLIEDGQPKIIEFVGKKGRGKTSHLKLLHQQLPQYPFFSLHAQSSFQKVFTSNARGLFIDSIHHFNMIQRIRLFKTNKTIVLTTHWGRFLEIKLAGKQHQRFDFKGIDATILKAILKNRMQVAAIESEINLKINDDEVEVLIKKYGDNYRGILNHLYGEFQKKYNP